MHPKLAALPLSALEAVYACLNPPSQQAFAATCATCRLAACNARGRAVVR